jgi:tetrahydromethanopterin S-methyltransferase subunit F
MQLLPIKTKYRTLNFILKWIFATLLGFSLSLLMIEISEKPDMDIIEALIGSLSISLPQSYILRKTISPLSWVLSTVFAWLIIAAIGVDVLGWTVTTADFLPPRIFAGIIAGGIGGLLIGISQWWLAIPPSFSSAWKWVFVNIISWMIAIPIGSTAGLFLHRITNVFLGEVAGLAITWLLVAIFTGISAERIMKDL